jgi:hypothetical protein
LYNNSAYKKAKNAAETAASSVEDLQRGIELTNKKASALNGILEELDGRKNVFDDLVFGSTEFY